MKNVRYEESDKYYNVISPLSARKWKEEDDRKAKRRKGKKEVCKQACKLA